MTKLSCSVRSCVHNEENKCCLRDITVGGRDAVTTDSTECENFDLRSGNMTNSVASSCGCMDPNNELKVGCEAVNCIYNKKQMCRAEHIDIVGASAKNVEQTECCTFTMK